MSGERPEPIQIFSLGASPGRPVELFIPYSHRDEDLLNELHAHLAALRREDQAVLWWDRRIEAGEHWDDEIDGHLETAEIVVPLISSDFIASDYCYGKELKRTLERHERGECVVIPVIARACDWQHLPFGKIQTLPRDAKPITSWSNRDEAWADVAKGIRSTIEKRGPPSVVSGSERLSPSALVALRANSAFRQAVPSPDEIILICPDHAYENESFLCIVIFAGTDNPAPLVAEIKGGEFVGFNGERQGQQVAIVPYPGDPYQGKGVKHASLKVIPSETRIDIEVSGLGLRNAHAGVSLAPFPHEDFP